MNAVSGIGSSVMASPMITRLRIIATCRSPSFHPPEGILPAEGMSTLGLRIPSGSSARLIARNISISAGERVSTSHRFLAVPIPCSALMLPPDAGDQSEHRVVDPLVVGRDPGHVDVDVAVAHVAEEPDLRVRIDRSHHAARPGR